jgi:methylenetetrahydrofolate--tRNA-(uracil-5-)-methyltransferase
MIPALAGAEFVRYGMIHRNTFLNSPCLLDATCRLKARKNIFAAGQLTGVEGYVESAASGLAMGVNAALAYGQRKPLVFPLDTALGALLNYIVTAQPGHFQPMNVNFGLLPPLAAEPRDKRLKNQMLADRALNSLAAFLPATGGGERS